MAAMYKQFLAAPNAELLADNASLHYVTTTISLTGSADIMKHLTGLSKHVQKKKQDVLNVVEGDNALVVEVNTELEFQISGGPYLPKLDDNFLTDRAAYLPITHFVFFNANGKISQIRLQWDQGSLLKQVEIIGKSGRNWPITDPRDQLTLIQSCLKSSGHAPSGSGQNHNERILRTRGSSSNALRDPHATLHMGLSRQELEEAESDSVVSPYAGKNRPRQRGFTEILGDEPEDEESPSTSRSSLVSPHKSGVNKNIQPMRLFDAHQEYAEDEDTPKGKISSFIKPNPKKYDHFDFSDGSDVQDRPDTTAPVPSKVKSKNDSNWSFQDFVTPTKSIPSRTTRGQDVRHWSTDDLSATNEATSFKPSGKSMGNSRIQFDENNATYDGGNHPRARAHGPAQTSSLFDREDWVENSQFTLGNVTKPKSRNQAFETHFAIADDSPAPAERKKGVPEARQKAVKMMNANWSAYDESPKAQNENKSRGKGNGNDANDADGTGINIAGNGMGGRKGTGTAFLYGSDADEDSSGINVKGDGMGGKKGTNRDWLYGE